MKRALILGGWGHGVPRLSPIVSLLEGFKISTFLPHEYLKAGGRWDAEAGEEWSVAIGYSMGALRILDLLSEGKLKTTRAILIAGFPTFVATDRFPYGLPLVELQKLQESVKSSGAAAIRSFWRSADSESPAEREGEKIPADDLLNALDYLARTDVTKRLSKILVPLSLLHGEDDSIASVEASHSIARAVPSAELSVIKKATHGSVLRDPAAKAIIREILAR